MSFENIPSTETKKRTTQLSALLLAGVAISACSNEEGYLSPTDAFNQQYVTSGCLKDTPYDGPELAFAIEKGRLVVSPKINTYPQLKFVVWQHASGEDNEVTYTLQPRNPNTRQALDEFGCDTGKD